MNSKLQCFQYKILHNTLPFNQKISDIYLLVHSSKTKRLWCTVIESFKKTLHIPPLSPQRAIFGFLEVDNKVFLILNYLVLLF